MKKQRAIQEKVFSFVRKHHMLNPGDKVLVGVSGGADSVCLLLLLQELGKQMPLSLEVVHINHKIRKEASEDALYVENLCKSLGIPFHLVEKQVKNAAALWKCSEEEAGRRVRYEAFEEISEQIGARRIAVAHNSNDLSETMLFHLFRGSGIKGLAGIPVCRDRIIRPILCLERQEIEEYLAAAGLSFCQDATNATDDYTRNRIRHHILPYAEQEIVSGCVSHMVQTAEMLQETEDYLELQTREALEGCVKQVLANTYQISVVEFMRLHPVLQKRILFSMIKDFSPHAKDITNVHVKDALELFRREGNREISLPFGIRCRREYNRVIVEKPGGMDTHEVAEAAVGNHYTMVTHRHDAMGFLPQNVENEYTKCFDYDKIEKPLKLRTRQIGDYLTIAGGDGLGRHQSLKDFFINKKIPASERDKVLLVAEDSHILWVVGYRISEYYKITENTKCILQVQLVKDKVENVGTY